MNPNIQPTKLDQVVSYLQSKGMTQQQVEEFLVNLNNIVAEQLYKRMMLELPEEDINYLESIPQDQFETEVSQKYQAVSGKTPAQLSQEILDNLATSILEETQKPEEPEELT